MAVSIAFKVGASNGNLGANGSVTATGLTTSGASLILISASVGNNSLSTVSGVTVGGAAATLGKRQVMPDAFSNAEVWWFWSTGALSSASVVVTFANSAGAGTNIDICEATGTDSSSIGNVGGANGTSGTSAASAVCSATGSVMYASSLNFGSSGTEAAGTNTTLLNAQNDGAGDFAASSINSQATSSGTTYTVTTTHTSGQWGMAVVEVKPAGSGAPTSQASTASLAPFNMVGPGRFRAGPKFKTPLFNTAVTVALAGSSATASPGTLTPAPQVPLVGTAATGSAGTLAPSSTVALTAPQISTAAGNITAGGDVTLSLTGIAATASGGAVTPSMTVGATGAAATSAAGTASPSIALGATGLSASASPGTLGDSRTVGLTGSAASVSAGTVSTFPAYVLTTAANGRYLLLNGRPAMIKGRTAWGVISLNAADLAEFLDDVVAHGFVAIEFQTPDHLAAIRNNPQDGSGNLPFTNTLAGGTWNGTFPGNTGTSNPDLTTPNSAFWANADALIAGCLSRGLLCLNFAAYLGIGTSEGWQTVMTANGSTKTQAYGAFIANRYKTYPNIVWMTAGDTASGFTEELDLITGLQSVSGQASTNFSAERNGGSISSDGSGALGAAMTLNGAYDWATVIAQCRRAYAFGTTTRAIPAYLLEEPYDEEGSDGTGVNVTFATQPTRRYEWWGWMETIGGYVAGNGYIWPFQTSGSPGTSQDNWKNHKNTQATQDLARLNAFVETIEWWRLVPSGQASMRTLIPGGSGAVDTATYISSACHEAGTLLLAYSPPGGGGAFTVDLRSMVGRKLRARWWDPTAATFSTNASAAGTFSLTNAASAQSFTPPASNSAGDADFLLFIDAETAYGAIAAAPFNVVGPGRFARGPRPGLMVPFASAQGNVTVALTGASATASAGTLGVTETLAATGSSATSAAGTLAPAESLGLTGTATTGSTGTLTPSASVGVTGSAATSSAGTATPANSVPAAGSAATSTIGSVTPSETVGLAGSQAPTSAGNVTAPGGSALTGSSATAGPGTTTPAGSVAAVGSATTSAAGTASPALIVALAGSAATVSQGAATPSAARALTGSAGTGSSGTLAPAAAVSLAGGAATAARGTITATGGAGDVTVALTGATLTLVAGTMVSSRVTQPRHPTRARALRVPGDTRAPRTSIRTRKPRGA